MPAEDAPALLADRYRLDHVIGRGPRGTVWAATDLVLRRYVAIKDVLLPPLDSEADRVAALTLLLRDARAAARISDPAAVRVYDAIDHGDGVYLLMEYLPVPSLEARVRRQGALADHDVTALGERLAGALAAAHALDVLHRDLTPANVLVPDDGPAAAKLVDFGIPSVSGAPYGPRSYLAPEHAAGGRSSAAGDVYSLGATLWFASEGAGRSGLLTEILTAMLAEDPARRPTIAEVRAGFAALATAPADASPVASPVAGPDDTRAFDAGPKPQPVLGEEPARRWDKRLLVGLATVVLVLGAAIGAGAALRTGGEEEAAGAGETDAPTTTSEPEPDPATTSTPPTTSPPSTPQTPPPPADERGPQELELYRDPQGGFTVDLPEGFTVELDESRRVTEAVAGDTRIGIQWFEDAVDPLEALLDEEQRLATFPRYERVRIEDEAFGGGEGAVWEFRFAQNGAPDELLRSRGRAFEVDGRTFLLFVRSSDGEFAGLDDETFSAIEDSFVPERAPDASA